MPINYKLQKIENHTSNINSSAIGKFYIISTPIGNIKDITIRGLDILNFVDKIVCEDTRVTGRLLMHYGIKKPMIVYNDHSSVNERDKIVNYLLNNDNIAFVSDAGTPLISDPGYCLVNAVIEAGIDVTSIPGACSVITALTLAGLPTNSFTFIGFLPKTKQSRLNELESAKEIKTTLIFFETAKRLLDALNDVYAVLGNRRVAIMRELTKLYEEVRRGYIDEEIKYWQNKELKGEFVIVLEGAIEKELSELEIEDQMKVLLNEMSFKDAVEFADSSLKIKKKKAYEVALRIKKNM